MNTARNEPQKHTYIPVLWSSLVEFSTLESRCTGFRNDYAWYAKPTRLTDPAQPGLQYILQWQFQFGFSGVGRLD